MQTRLHGLAAAQKTFPDPHGVASPALPTPLSSAFALASSTYLHLVVVLVAVRPTAGDDAKLDTICAILTEHSQVPREETFSVSSTSVKILHSTDL